MKIQKIASSIKKETAKEVLSVDLCQYNILIKTVEHDLSMMVAFFWQSSVVNVSSVVLFLNACAV